MRTRLFTGLLLACALLGLTVPAAALSRAAASTVTFSCQGSAVGQTSTLTLNQAVDASAPATVAPGGAVRIVLTPAPTTLPTEAGGYPVNSVKGLQLTVPVPANASYVAATLSGGANLGGTPTVTQQGANLVIAVPGPINGGATFQLPALTLDLTAGSSGSITSTIAGTSYDDPGLTFTASVTVVGLPVDVPTKCFPSPQPSLTTTTIG